MATVRRTRLRIKKVKQQKLYVVYTAYIGRTIYYIGQGTLGREKHVNSGCSHVYELNKMHFEGKVFELRLEKYQTKEEAAKREEELIREKRPKFNKAFLDDKRTRRMQVLGILRVFIFDKAMEFRQFRKCTMKDIQRLENIVGMNSLLLSITGLLHKNMHEDAKYNFRSIEQALIRGSKRDEFMNYFYTLQNGSSKCILISDSVLKDFYSFLEIHHKDKINDFNLILQERDSFLNETRRKINTTNPDMG